MSFAARSALITQIMLLAGCLGAAPTSAQTVPPQPPETALPPEQPPPVIRAPSIPAQPPANQYSPNELIDAGHHFFGGVSRGLATIVEKAVSEWGQPNGYILGEEAGGAFVGGLRYGDGTLYTKNAGDVRVYWQGPTLGFDAGADGARTMMLVYNLPRTEAIFERFRRHRRLGVFCRGFRHDGFDVERHRRGADPFRRWVSARGQSWLSQIHPAPYLEPVLIAICLLARRRLAQRLLSLG